MRDPCGKPQGWLISTTCDSGVCVALEHAVSCQEAENSVENTVNEGKERGPSVSPWFSGRDPLQR